MSKDDSFPYHDVRFADIELLRYQVPDFEGLDLRSKLYVYHLSEAALWGRDILWDQNCRWNLDVRHMLEDIYLSDKVCHEGKDWEAFLGYIRQVWFANGIHHHYATDKFVPGFSAEWLRAQYALVDNPRVGADRVDDVVRVVTDPSVLKKRVCQSGEDKLLESASNYYADDITEKEAVSYYNAKKSGAADKDRPVMYGLNSRLERDDKGNLTENVYKVGGLYGQYLERIVAELRMARPYACNVTQQQVIDCLVGFYETGSLEKFDEYTIRWVGETKGDIDFTNGFTEVYGDPLGLKASWEGYVNILDKKATGRTEKLCQNAQWFEDNSPVDGRFKKKECRGVSARVVEAAILGGDLYPSSAIGINLPNSNWVRAEHGSKSVTIGNLTHAYDMAAKGNGFREEFIPDTGVRALVDKYGDVCDDLHTDLHECLGHGSGQLLPGVDADALGVYGSTIEEARADLFGLYYLADQKLVELGLTPDLEAWKSQYYTYMMNGLMTQLVRIEPGREIEEAHMRNRALIAHWCLEMSQRFQITGLVPPAMELKKVKGKTALVINDYATLRQYVGQLLAEVQRIKSEGDFGAAEKLVETYGVKVDKTLHEEVLCRYKALCLAPYKGFINPRYTLVRDKDGKVTDVTISYGEPYEEQMLRYSREYSLVKREK